MLAAGCCLMAGCLLDLATAHRALHLLPCCRRPAPCRPRSRARWPPPRRRALTPRWAPDAAAPRRAVRWGAGRWPPLRPRPLRALLAARAGRHSVLAAAAPLRALLAARAGRRRSAALRTSAGRRPEPWPPAGRRRRRRRGPI
ncbi:hypothetical protein BS78_05G027100 [Paspalum vaginatum]|nr:hypothetical protein BS78_05G027100 [Paspalum vaginatum]